jgi:hypothetical protein
MDKSPNCPSVKRDVNLFITHTTLKKLMVHTPSTMDFIRSAYVNPPQRVRKNQKRNKGPDDLIPLLFSANMSPKVNTLNRGK